MAESRIQDEPPSGSPPNKKQPRTARIFSSWVDFCDRHTGKVLLILLGVALASGFLASRLELHTDFSELLPKDHPAVEATRRIFPRQKSATNLVIIVHSPDAEATRRFAEGMRPELDRLVTERVLTEVQWTPSTEQADFFGKWKWLYADMADLEKAESLLDRVIAQRTSPLLVDLEGSPDEELAKLRADLNKKLPKQDPVKYFEKTEDGEHWLGVLLWQKQEGLATASEYTTMRKVEEIVAKLRPASFHPKLRVEYTGNIAQALDEQSGIREDLTVATLLCMGGVLTVIWLYFRRVALLIVVGAPAVLGLLCALAIASVTVSYLNINTAFLISIILGNGINAPIILLARYGEERRAEIDVRSALVTALSGTFLGTLAAMASAAIAYGSLLATSFRGFNQFGMIGGAGMLLVWIATFLLVPAMVIWGERRWPGSLTPRRNIWRTPFARFGSGVQRWPILTSVVVAILLAASIRPLLSYLKDPFEWNMDNLRTDDTPSQKLWGRKENLGIIDVGAGYVGNNGVFLVDKPEQAEAVAEAIRKQDAALGKDHMLREVRTINSVLPSKQDEKLELLARVRKKLDKHKDMLDTDDKALVDAWRPPDSLRRLKPEDLWKQILDAFTEVDGTRGRFIGVDADPERFYSWNGHDLLRISKVLKVNALGKEWVAASWSTIFAAMLETILSDGPRVTLISLIGVSLLLLGMFGPRGAVPVLLSLALGLAWLGGILGVWSLKVNFMNFVALPITLGVGADYAANIWARIRNEPDTPMAEIIGDTGSAVALCSLTTIIGYATLLKSRNHALRSFGILAVLGEVTCLLAALIVLPLLARWLFRSRDRARRA